MDLASIAVAATEATAERTVLAVARFASADDEEEDAIFGGALIWNWFWTFDEVMVLQKLRCTIYRENVRLSIFSTMKMVLNLSAHIQMWMAEGRMGGCFLEEYE